MKQIVVALLLLFTTSPIFAADASLVYQSPTVEPAPTTAGIVQRLVVITTIVLGICVGIFCFARRENRVPPPNGMASHHIRLLSSTPVGAGETIFLVQAGTLRLAVSAGKQGIESISLVNDSFSNVLATLTEPLAA